MATKIKVNGKWYRGNEKSDGSIEFKDDLNYYGSTTEVEYTAKKPNPVLHSGLYHVYNKNGGKEGEFWTDPQISYSGYITDIETDLRSGSGSSTASPPNSSFPRRDDSSGCLGWIFSMLLFLFLSNWGGRIGVILGIVFTIIIIASDGAADLLNGIFVGFFTIFLLGIVGFIIGGIVKFIIRTVQK